MVPNRPAAQSGRIDVGDMLVAVDGWPVQVIIFFCIKEALTTGCDFINPVFILGERSARSHRQNFGHGKYVAYFVSQKERNR